MRRPACLRQRVLGSPNRARVSQGRPESPFLPSPSSPAARPQAALSGGVPNLSEERDRHRCCLASLTLAAPHAQCPGSPRPARTLPTSAHSAVPPGCQATHCPREHAGSGPSADGSYPDGEWARPGRAAARPLTADATGSRPAPSPPADAQTHSQRRRGHGEAQNATGPDARVAPWSWMCPADPPRAPRPPPAGRARFLPQGHADALSKGEAASPRSLRRQRAFGTGFGGRHRKSSPENRGQWATRSEGAGARAQGRPGSHEVTTGVASTCRARSLGRGTRFQCFLPVAFVIFSNSRKVVMP